jgi:ubiquinone/menaquinone biosynthesis C-methylase UbiE
MSLEFRIRDFFYSRQAILQEAGIKPGFKVLDYGCGPGSYVVAAAALVGKAGRVYALDAHPLAIKMVKGIISRKHLTNAETIHSECATGLTAKCLDIVLLYDTLHDLTDSDAVLGEIQRTLKPGGWLSVSDHHLKEAELVPRITSGGLFRLSGRGKNTYTFTRR